MSIAEDLRRDADDALSDGGMYYSGEYLSGIAERVEEVEAKNEKLCEMCSDLMGWVAYTTMGERVPEDAYCALEDRMSALGIGADE